MGKTKDLHVTLPEDTVRHMARLAKERGVKQVQLFRLAIERYLAEAAREKRDRELRAYVAEMAEHSGEFVSETGPMTERLLLEETEW